MSNEFKKYMAYLLLFAVVAMLLISSISDGKDAIKTGADNAGGYVSCKLALCPTPAQTSQKNK